MLYEAFGEKVAWLFIQPCGEISSVLCLFRPHQGDKCDGVKSCKSLKTIMELAPYGDTIALTVARQPFCRPVA